MMCINNGTMHGHNYGYGIGTAVGLTNGKTYNVEEDPYGGYLVTDDNGKLESYLKDRFINISEVRERKLKEIGIND